MQFIQRVLQLISYPFQLIFAAPIALISLSHRVRGMSLAAQLALLVAVFMVLMTIVATVVDYFRLQRPDFMTSFNNYTLRLGIITIITPPVVYLAVWLWGEGRESRFPDI